MCACERFVVNLFSFSKDRLLSVPTMSYTKGKKHLLLNVKELKILSVRPRRLNYFTLYFQLISSTI